MTITTGLPDEIRPVLQPGESVVWHGRPRQGLILRVSDLPVMGFGLAFLYGVAILFRDSGGDVALPALLFGVVMGIVGIALVGSPVLEARRRDRTLYVVTSERVLAIQGKDTAAIGLGAVSRVTVSGESVIIEALGKIAAPIPELEDLANPGEVVDVIERTKERFAAGDRQVMRGSA